jgi:hypothetical protein
LRRPIKKLWELALEKDAHTIGVYENFRRKFNATLAASEAHAKVLYAVGEFDRAGVSFADWIASDAEWAESVKSLSPIDAVGFLAARAGSGAMQVAASSTPQPVPPVLRRLENRDPVETELHMKEYLQLTVTFPTSDDPSPVYLLAFEWSDTLRDWQIFNFVKASLLDIAKPLPVSLNGDGAVARLAVGVKIGGPPDNFDLFVLGQRTPFDHRARSYLDNLHRRDQLTSLEMGRLVDILFKGPTMPDVAATRYAVID